jgi:phage antirepressor YoqD-like protein
VSLKIKNYTIVDSEFDTCKVLKLKEKNIIDILIGIKDNREFDVVTEQLINIGYFSTKEEAVQARDNYIIENNLPHKLSTQY